MNRLEQQLAKKLDERRIAGNMRQLSTRRAAVDFYSNDYLGLATSNTLAKMITEQFGGTGNTGSTGSRLLSGNSSAMEALEATIAAFHGSEAALLFNSGFDANTGLIASIAQRHTTLLYDELCHASIIDGIRLSICTGKYKFRHNDLNELGEKLKKFSGSGTVVVIAESVYSMDGDMAPLTGMAQLCNRYGAQLIVDEAHATGVFGEHGEGLVCALGLQDQVFARVHTFGKALGCQGAAVLGSTLLRQYLVNFARSFIYTTAASENAIRAISCAYQWLASPHFSNQELHQLIASFRQEVAKRGLSGWKDSNSAIQAYLLPAELENTVDIASLALQIQAAGLQVNAIMHPTVPRGMERLRVCLHSFNTMLQVNMLLDIVSGKTPG